MTTKWTYRAEMIMRATPQRAALEQILKGTHGGLPWMILAATIDQWLETAYVAFEWRFDGPRSHYKAGTEVQTALDSMRNPVSGLESIATILLPNGLVCKKLHPTATRIYSVFTKGMKIAAPGRYGFYTVTEHGNGPGSSSGGLVPRKSPQDPPDRTGSAARQAPLNSG